MPRVPARFLRRVTLCHLVVIVWVTAQTQPGGHVPQAAPSLCFWPAGGHVPKGNNGVFQAQGLKPWPRNSGLRVGARTEQCDARVTSTAILCSWGRKRWSTALVHALLSWTGNWIAAKCRVLKGKPTPELLGAPRVHPFSLIYEMPSFLAFRNSTEGVSAAMSLFNPKCSTFPPVTAVTSEHEAHKKSPQNAGPGKC